LSYVTENSNDHIVLHNLHGAVTKVVDITEGVSPVNEVLPRCAEIGTNMQRKKLKAAR